MTSIEDRPPTRITTGFYYLPRTFAPFPQCELLGVHDEKPESNDQLSSWQSFEVLPTPPQGAVAPTVTDLRVSVIPFVDWDLLITHLEAACSSTTSRLRLRIYDPFHTQNYI